MMMHRKQINIVSDDGCLVYAPVPLLERMYKLIFRFLATETSAFPQSADFMKTRLDGRDSSIDFKTFYKPIKEMILLRFLNKSFSR